MDWRQSRWVRTAVVVCIGAAGVYGLVYHDVVSRAKESYLEGEKYMDWAAHPEKKKQAYEEIYENKKRDLDNQLAEKKISDADHRSKLEAIAFDRDFAINESSLKYAYQWYKDTYELFSPPESKWVTLARAKAPAALELWKKELREQKIPFEDTMFE